MNVSTYAIKPGYNGAVYSDKPIYNDIFYGQREFDPEYSNNQFLAVTVSKHILTFHLQLYILYHIQICNPALLILKRIFNQK